MATPLKLKLPELFAVAVSDVPPSVTTAPLPEYAGLIVPEMLHVEGTACAVKAIPDTSAPLTVTELLAGENV